MFDEYRPWGLESDCSSTLDLRGVAWKSGPCTVSVGFPPPFTILINSDFRANSLFVSGFYFCYSFGLCNGDEKTTRSNWNWCLARACFLCIHMDCIRRQLTQLWCQVLCLFSFLLRLRLYPEIFCLSRMNWQRSFLPLSLSVCQVLDGLLAQCGTVENCEQGKTLPSFNLT